MVSTNATNALWLIAETGDTHQVESVLNDGADINASNEHGMTALMRAVSKGHSRMVRVLLEHGADPNQSRNDKFTPLLLAAFFGHHDIVKLLVEHGADTCATTRFETSAQMWASARTFQEVAHYLDKPPTARTFNKPAVENCGSPIQTEGKTSSVKDSEAVNLRTPSFAFETTAQKNDRIAARNGFTPIGSVPIPVAKSEIQEAAPAFVLTTWFSSRPQLLDRQLLVYSLTGLVLLVALIVGFAMRGKQHLDELRRSSHSTVVSGAVAAPTTDVQQFGEAKKVFSTELQVGRLGEHQRADNDAGRTTSKQRFVPRSGVSNGDLAARKPTEEPKEIASTDASRSMPDNNADDVHNPSLPPVSAVTALTAKPQPVSRVNGPRKGPAPLSPLLISPSNSATTRSRTIQWP